MCFMQMAISGASRNYTVGLIVIAFYLLIMVPIVTSNLGTALSTYKSLTRLPFAFFVLLTIMNFIYSRGSSVVDMTLLACIVMFYLFLVHSIDDGKAIEHAIIGYGLGSCILSILFYFGVGVEYDVDYRLWMFGSNPNELGTCICLGMFVVLIKFIVEDILHLKLFKFIFVVPILLSFPIILATGSRTALFELLLMFIITIIIYPTKKTFLKVFMIIGGAYLAYFYLSRLVNTDMSIARRLLTTFEEGNTGGRTEIWERYIPHIFEHPIFGIGEAGFNTLGQDLNLVDSRGYGLSPHNVIIEVLLYTGFVGLSIMIAFWGKVAKRAFLIFKETKAILPLLVTIPILADILSGQILNAKFAWLIYAYIIITYNNNHCSSIA